MSLAAFSLLGVNLMLAHVAADATAQLTWWAVLLLSAAGSIGGSALTLVVGLWTLSRTEAYRRAARWEPMAEELWRERAKAYREILTIYDDAIMAMAVAATKEVPDRMAQTAIVAANFQTATLHLSPVSSIKVHDAASDIAVAFKDRIRGREGFIEFNASMHKQLNTLVNAMRADLGVEAMDEKTKDWFPLPAEVFAAAEKAR